MRRITLAATGAAVLLAAGCSGGSLPAGNHPAAAVASSAPTAGPFRIRPLYCGKFTSAQRAQFGTHARGGFIYRYTDTSQSFTGTPQVTVNFMNGATVAGSNVAGDSPSVSPGQNAEAEVDAVGGSGQNLTFTACAPTNYVALNSAGTEVGGTYPG